MNDQDAEHDPARAIFMKGITLGIDDETLLAVRLIAAERGTTHRATRSLSQPPSWPLGNPWLARDIDANRQNVERIINDVHNNGRV